MQKWQYLYAIVHGDKVTRIDEIKQVPQPGLMSFLQDIGSRGRELVSSGPGDIGFFLIFKKPLEELNSKNKF